MTMRPLRVRSCSVKTVVHTTTVDVTVLGLVGGAPGGDHTTNRFLVSYRPLARSYEREQSSGSGDFSPQPLLLIIRTKRRVRDIAQSSADVARS
jgi:hypothetical protein